MVVPQKASVLIGRLHVITDTRTGHDPIATATAALAAGAPVLQVRVSDDYTDAAAYDLTTHLAELCDQAGATCLVNNRLHIARATAAGGHVGATDLPIHAARAVLGPRAILGGTCRNPETARALRRAGADYLGAGPAYLTTTKTGLPQPLGPQTIGRIAAAVDIPVIAIGGITPDTVAPLIAAGAHGVAVVGAISTAPDPYAATGKFLAAIDSALQEAP